MKVLPEGQYIICSLKLRRELATYANHPPETHYRITDAELEDYRGAHAPRAGRGLYTSRAAQDF